VIETLVILLAAALAAALLYAVWRIRYRFPPPSLPQVLCYHKVTRGFCWEGTWTTPRLFFATVDRLLARGYRFIGEDEYLAALAGEAGDPSRLFLTFDDGYAAVREHVFDGLARRSVPFHVFVVSDYAGRNNEWDLSLGRRPFRHASWDELREMVEAGVTVGSHGATHRDLTRLSDGAVAEELTRSKRAIEEALGVPVRTLSYPFGRYNALAARAAAAAGYEAAFSLYPRHSNERVERFALRRNGVYIIDPPRVVEGKLRPHTFFWFEEMKCRAINAVAALTPALKDR
jgi:peptidoglycan/xylan/chitin deacetylase (PgdA/CDA1 family)